MAPNQHVAQQIGHAWEHHREGRNDEAINEFRQILSQAPDSVDAYYGLGLAQRVAGDNDSAIESFRKALQITEETLEATKKLANAKGTVGDNANDLSSVDDDRYMMLRRMLNQRLVEMGALSEEELPKLL